MNTLRKPKERIALVLCSLIVLLAQTSYAHVYIIAPNGGENFEIGSTVTISWAISVQHNLLNWDLYYTKDGDLTTLIPIAISLPGGDPMTGSIHSYEWTVPDVPSDQVRITVVMNNSFTNYSDISDGDFTISVAPCCFISGDADSGGDVNIGDATYVVKYIFADGLAPLCCDEADADGGGDVNIGDATFIVKYIFADGAAPNCPDPGGLFCP
ncbi:MAG: hypothetical protein IIB00_04660 [candidate division Zixibacteria bacterium]|nr:hypothetical protein [candidate division Zixibacteria bacterium]